MVPTGWLKSTAPNTGKTEILIAINSFAGWWHKKVTMGASSSLPAVSKRLMMQRDLSLCLDEVATKVNADQEQRRFAARITLQGRRRERCGRRD